MGKAQTIKVSDIPVSRRGRTVQLDTELVSDLKKLYAGRVQALNLAPYFEGKDLGEQKVRQAIGQNIRKNWTHADGVNADGGKLRLDFSPDMIAARVRQAEEATAEAEAPATA